MVGCHHQTFPARQFTLKIDPASARDAVVLVELVEQSGGGDCPQFDPEVTRAVQVLAPDADGRVSITKPAVDSDVWWLGLRRREQFARWTIFARGCVVTTIYPEGRDIRDSGVESGPTLTTRLGWRAPYVGGFGRYDDVRPTQAVGAPYATQERAPIIRLALRPLPPRATPLKPDPDWHSNDAIVPPADGLCPADAATLQWQVNQLLLLQQQKQLPNVTPEQTSLLLSTLEAQAAALMNGGLETSLANELTQSVAKLREALRV
jgi:hypothetical protein